MSFFLAVANRKGGVGKSTISVMLAHAFAVWGRRKVLLIDLDAQSNSSLILIGGTEWIEAQRHSRNIAAFVEDRLHEQVQISDYIVNGSGDIMREDGKAPNLSLLSGSLRFEDMQDELITSFSRHSGTYLQAKNRCAVHFSQALSQAAPLADLIIMDCAPGLSNATAAALRLADKVIVPFRPDAVSEFAVDKISTIIEAKPFDEVLETPKGDRRYTCLANYVRPGGQDRIAIDTIGYNHPVLSTRMPMSQDLANAFFFADEPQTLEEKYASAATEMKALYEELHRQIVE